MITATSGSFLLELTNKSRSTCSCGSLNRCSLLEFAVSFLNCAKRFWECQELPWGLVLPQAVKYDYHLPVRNGQSYVVGGRPSQR